MSGTVDFTAYNPEPKRKTTPQKAKSGIVQTLPVLIATLIVILTISLIWTDIKLKDLISIKFAGDLLAFILLFWMMFFTLQTSGNTNGMRDFEYVAARNHYRAERTKVRDTGAELDLPDFCDFYVKKEIHDYRRSILLNANIRVEEWEQRYSNLDDHALLVLLPPRKFKRKMQTAELSADDIVRLREIRKLSPRKKNAIVKACLARPIEVTPDLMMLDDGERTSRVPISEKSIKQKQAQRDIFALCRITLMMFLSISIAGDIVVDFSYSTLVFGLIKLASLTVTGYQGYTTGYTVYTEYGVQRLNDQINLFAVFWRWKKDYATAPEEYEIPPIQEETKVEIIDEGDNIEHA